MSKAPHIIFSIINDATHDRRMFRIADTLSQHGYKVTLVGRAESGKTYPTAAYSFQIKRLTVPFKSGKGMYFLFNLYLTWHLLFSKVDILGAVDLDTLLPNRIVGWLRKKPVVYDAHELFTEVPELLNRNEQKLWSWLEKKLVPGIKYAYTVGPAIAQWYNQRYGVPFEVIRNVPPLISNTPTVTKYEAFTVAYVGMLNAGRGLDLLFKAIQGTTLHVVICGTGVELPALKALVNQLGIDSQVTFLGHVPPYEMAQVLQKAQVGYCVLDSKSLSYYYSLANKFYDYIHAEIPQIVSDFPEYQASLAQFKTGLAVANTPKSIRDALLELQQNKTLYAALQQACLEAKHQLNWQNEQRTLLHIYQHIKPI